jgi:hypothetical protein
MMRSTSGKGKLRRLSRVVWIVASAREEVMRALNSAMAVE